MGNRFYPNRFSWLEDEPAWHLFGAFLGLALGLLGGFALATEYNWQALAYSHGFFGDLVMTVCGLLAFVIDIRRYFKLRKRRSTSNA